MKLKFTPVTDLWLLGAGNETTSSLKNSFKISRFLKNINFNTTWIYEKNEIHSRRWIRWRLTDREGKELWSWELEVWRFRIEAEGGVGIGGSDGGITREEFWLWILVMGGRNRTVMGADWGVVLEVRCEQEEVMDKGKDL